jgi:hypothetical protein
MDQLEADAERWNRQTREWGFGNNHAEKDNTGKTHNGKSEGPQFQCHRVGIGLRAAGLVVAFDR